MATKQHSVRIRLNQNLFGNGYINLYIILVLFLVPMILRGNV